MRSVEEKLALVPVVTTILRLSPSEIEMIKNYVAGENRLYNAALFCASFFLSAS